MATQVLDLEELTALLGYVNRRALVRAIRLGRFPIPTYEISPGRVVADVQVVNEYFERKRLEGMKELGETGPLLEI